MNLDHLLDQAKAGTIAKGDLDSVARRLRERPERREAYTLIHILGAGGATGERELVESFLEGSAQPMLARIALAALVDHWGLGVEYRDTLRDFVRGVAWDTEDDVRHLALTSAGELARTTWDAQLVADLLAIQGDPAEDDLTRDIAFKSLARAVGASYQEQYSRTSRHPWVATILARAETLAAAAP